MAKQNPYASESHQTNHRTPLRCPQVSSPNRGIAHDPVCHVRRVDTLAGLIQPAVRADGFVAVDMGEPIFAPVKIPTTLAANTADGKVVAAEIEVAGSKWSCTLVSGEGSLNPLIWPPSNMHRRHR